ncbi:AraC family transcriptional regulator [Emticicia sp. 21SJ11W-3]|uniref:helix-turn-helix domain-containing protein n=1 Tax=Emticicia sp. 21SJ11W-3 TaxID=2916755 RepID=UPI00209E412F|nr:helix-turn-helix transcriptional regulator [Emticicia sp. 21SJ11W-3]UTA68436.1 helix-turn-helix transcriptional regulator [Emticicia sp. 21SJ11W-3]
MKTPDFEVFIGITKLMQALGLPNPYSSDFQLYRFEEAMKTRPALSPVYRSDCYIFALITSGRLAFKVGISDFMMQAGTLYFLSPWHLQQYHRLEDLTGYICFFNENFFASTPEGLQCVKDLPMYQLEGRAVFDLTADQQQPFIDLFELMLKEAGNTGASRWDILRHLMQIFFIKAQETYQAHTNQTAGDSKNQRLTSAFERLLEEHFLLLSKGRTGKVFSVNEFAEQLNVHPNHLSNMLRRELGKSAKQLINERLAFEAKSLLHTTELSVTEIAYRLRFDEPTNFTKFFKKSTGMLPREYRMQTA